MKNNLVLQKEFSAAGHWPGPVSDKTLGLLFRTKVASITENRMSRTLLTHKLIQIAK